MYVARAFLAVSHPDIVLKDSYFTQDLLPDYQKDFPEHTADWDVVYDDRGHLVEPHTDCKIGLGTLSVRRLLYVRGNI